MDDIHPGSPIVYEDRYGTCRWGLAVSRPECPEGGAYPLVQIRLKGELPQWVPASYVYPAATRELPRWAREVAA
jgi:hypothetical protein